MARQQRLMESLGPEPSTSPRRAPTPGLSAEEKQARLATEQKALEAAFESLAEGRLDAARNLLEPLADAAQDTRTLTTLSRIYSSQGRSDLALDHLQRAEAIDPADPKVIHFMAELLWQLGRRVEELHYRRRAAFTTTDAPAAAFVRLISAVVKAAPLNRPPPLAEIRLALDRVKAASDLAPELRIEAAQSVFGIPSLTEDAISIYTQAEPPLASEHDVVASRYTLQEWCSEHSAPLHRISEFGMAGRRPMLAELKNAIVVPAFQWLPLLDDGRAVLSQVAASRMRLRSDDPQSPLLMSGKRQALLRLPKNMPQIEEPVLLLGGGGGYYQDLVEYTSALAISETLNLGTDLKILVNANLAPHQLELFDVLGVSQSRLVKWEPARPVRVAQLWMPTRLTAGGNWFDPLLPHWYRQKMVGLLAGAPPSRKLYLSRSASTQRRVENEAEVISALQPLGFECIRPETMSLRAQVALFSQASHIVGPSGGAMTNMLFAPAGTRVTILLSRQLIEGGSDVSFDALAQACAHEASIEPCDPSRLVPGQRSVDADIVVDCARLVAALS